MSNVVSWSSTVLYSGGSSVSNSTRKGILMDKFVGTKSISITDSDWDEELEKNEADLKKMTSTETNTHFNLGR